MNDLKVVVEQKPAEINANFEEIKLQLAEQMEVYKTAIYSEDKVTEARKDIATLRKIRKAIDDKRKEVKGTYMIPYEEFDRKSKELMQIIDDAINPINSQIADFEERRKAEKKQKALDYFNACMASKGNIISFEEVFKQSWLNAATSFKSIRMDIDAAIKNREDDIATIKAMNSEVEDKAMATYQRTKRLADAIQVINDYEQQKRIILEREEARRRAEEERKQREAERLRLEELRRREEAELERKREQERFLEEERRKVREEEQRHIREQYEAAKKAAEAEKEKESVENPFGEPEEEPEEESPFGQVEEDAEEESEVFAPAQETENVLKLVIAEWEDKEGFLRQQMFWNKKEVYRVYPLCECPEDAIVERDLFSCDQLASIIEMAINGKYDRCIVKTVHLNGDPEYVDEEEYKKFEKELEE